MTSQHLLVRPTTAHDAIDLVLAAPLPFDTPTNRRLRERALLERAFASGRRRPELVWAARDGDRVLACVAGLAVGDAVVLDHWGGDPARGLDLPLEAATAAARELPGSEACLHVPAGDPTADPAVTAWVEALSRHGWRLLVRRRHYETAATPSLARVEPSQLRVEQLSGPDDPRLRSLVRAVLEGSLDAHDVELVTEVGLERAATQTAADLLEADPWQCLRLAFDDEGDLVGLVSWVALPDGRGYVNHVGVAAPARGRGYGRQLLALATRALMSEGSTTLVADTDEQNHPMVAAFAAIGWTAAEGRLDLIPV